MLVACMFLLQASRYALCFLLDCIRYAHIAFHIAHHTCLLILHRTDTRSHRRTVLLSPCSVVPLSHYLLYPVSSFGHACPSRLPLSRLLYPVPYAIPPSHVLYTHLIYALYTPPVYYNPVSSIIVPSRLSFAGSLSHHTPFHRPLIPCPVVLYARLTVPSSSIHDPQSAIHNPQSTIHRPIISSSRFRIGPLQPMIVLFLPSTTRLSNGNHSTITLRSISIKASASRVTSNRNARSSSPLLVPSDAT